MIHLYMLLWSINEAIHVYNQINEAFNRVWQHKEQWLSKGQAFLIRKKSFLILLLVCPSI